FHGEDKPPVALHSNEQPEPFGLYLREIPERNTLENLGLLAQQPEVDVTVKGLVLGEDGEPLPGATITVEGSTAGTVTDMEGYYSITVPEDAVLVFSYIGYEAQRISVGNQSEINVTLSVDLSSLEEVVVVGYGVQKRMNLTGAVDQVTSEELQGRNVT